MMYDDGDGELNIRKGASKLGGHRLENNNLSELRKRGEEEEEEGREGGGGRKSGEATRNGHITSTQTIKQHITILTRL